KAMAVYSRPLHIGRSATGLPPEESGSLAAYEWFWNRVRQLTSFEEADSDADGSVKQLDLAESKRLSETFMLFLLDISDPPAPRVESVGGFAPGPTDIDLGPTGMSILDTGDDTWLFGWAGTQHVFLVERHGT